MLLKLQLLALGKPAVSVQFFRDVMNSAPIPDAARPGRAAKYKCGTPQEAWMWIKNQAKEHLSAPECARLAAPGSIIGTSSPVLRRIARCHRPLQMSPADTGSRNEMRNVP